ncbi:MAG: hypothetical protein IJN17_01545 [Clostridia bacterium]|nr:hypothetical protein [Clostridia bacterium]
MTQLSEFIDNKQSTEQPLKICFVCTGNTCRSPMAAAVLNHLGNGNYVATSAGIMADKDAPINPKAKEALIRAGIESTDTNNYKEHTARQLNMGIMESADRIVAVGTGHAMMIIQAFPLCASKVTSFEKAVTDPFGQSQEVYDKSLADITAEIKKMFALG